MRYTQISRGSQSAILLCALLPVLHRCAFVYVLYIVRFAISTTFARKRANRAKKHPLYYSIYRVKDKVVEEYT
jgi:hypothetical protein